MKKYLLFTIAWLTFSFTYGQNNSDHFAYKNLVKLSPIDLGLSKFQLHYERYLGEERKNSLLLIPSVYLRENSRENESGWEFMGQYRFYLTHVRKDEGRIFLGLHNYGFYAGVYGLMMELNTDYIREVYKENGRYTTAEYRSEIDAQEAGVILGMQIDITKRIILDFYVGGGIRNARVLDSYDPDIDYAYPYYSRDGVMSPSYKGVKPKVGFTLGMAF